MLVTQTQIGSSVSAPSSGYVGKLYLMAAEDVLYIAEPTDTEPLCMQVLAKVGAELVELPVRPKNCTFSETPATNGDGVMYGVSIQLSFPQKGNQSILNWAAANRRRRWVVLFQSHNGDNYIAGEVGNGLRLGLNTQGGVIGIGLSGQLVHTMWQLPTIVPAEIFSEVTFLSTDFSTEFELL